MPKIVKLKIVKPLHMDWKKFGQIMSDIDHQAYKIKNRAMTRYHMLVLKEMEYNEQHSKKMNADKRSEIYGYRAYESVIYNELKPDYKKYGFDSQIISGLIIEAINTYNKISKEILKGNAVLPTFKRNQPIPLQSGKIRIIDRQTIDIRVINKVGGEKYGVPVIIKSVPIHVVVASRKGHANIAMKRLIDGRYSLCDSMIQKKGKDIFILLCFKDNEVKQAAVSKDVILGVDLGIARAVTMAVSDSPVIDYINGGEIEAFRQKTEKQRISKHNQLKYCSNNRKGHGRKTLLSPLDDLSHKIERFRDTVNHRYSKYIVDTAIKNGCGVIQMENLSAIADTDSFLKNWSYYDLQQKTKYKAEEVGIEFRLIDPRYTSQRCYNCGTIDKENRKSQDLFHCINCGHKKNADANAAQNIAMDGIEEIIKEQVEFQKKVG